MAVLRWLLPRLGLRLLLLVGVLATVFILVDLLPGNAATQKLGANRTEEALAAAEIELGLDKPVYLRFVSWLVDAVQGDFGKSASGREISDLLAHSLPTTLITTGIAFGVTAACSIVIGLWWAFTRSNSFPARGIDISTTGLIAIPEFVVGVFFIAVFALWLRILPASSLVGSATGLDWTMYVLPVATLLVPQVAWNSRIVRSATSDVCKLPHVDAARLAGISERRLLWVHIFPLAAPAIAASLATSSGVLVAGTVAVETLFNHPGVGLVIASAVSQRDIPVLVAMLAVTGAMILLFLTIADGIKATLSPKGQL